MAQDLILVIDDEIETVELIRAAFQRCGYDVIGADRGTVGLQLARAHQPALVLIDLLLPEINGFEVCRQLRQDPATAHIPRVILSAGDSLTDRTEAAKAGADRYLMKPIGMKVLVSEVQRLLA